MSDENPLEEQNSPAPEPGKPLDPPQAKGEGILPDQTAPAQPNDPADGKDGQPLQQPPESATGFKDDFSMELRSHLLPDHKRGVFVVLGDRDEINQDCLEVMKRFKITPFIIHPNKSLTDTRSLKERITQNPKTDFAFVILTGDDFVYSRKDGKPATAKLKAEQEVVFLLGYLIGKFGIQNVFALYKPQQSFVFPTGAQNLNFVAYEKNGFWLQIFENRLKELGFLDTRT